MNWCRIIGHKWQYKTEDIVYQSAVLSSIPKEVEVPTKVRLCNRCHKKQMINSFGAWVGWSLTLDEVRHIKLKNLGI